VLLFDLPAKVQILSGIEHRCRRLRRIAKSHFYAEVQIVIGETVPMRQLPEESRGVAHSAGNAGDGSSSDIDPLRLMRQARDSDDASLQRILSYVDENLTEHMTREEIAHNVHFHPAYLSRFFRKKTGLSLSEYIMLKRIAYAKELLSDSEMKVSHIMSHLGYDNLSHFTRTFKRMTGCTPQQYRRNKPLH
ncbi:MAG: helix-turn-helix transcriptional regulator, partial [Cohnella sp.]|nr:helix-turn-helix transcriptional regulator [Cohnella sp.]